MLYEINNSDIVVRLTLDEGVNENEIFFDNFYCGFKFQEVASSLIYIYGKNPEILLDKEEEEIVQNLNEIDLLIEEKYSELEEEEYSFYYEDEEEII